MVNKILVANRGEIACRIIRTAKKMGIDTVAVYSEADSTAKHVYLADEAVYIGASSATHSYLNIEKIINAIKVSGADSVHPGYGFLSETAQFVEKLEKHGIIFIGPSSQSIKKMGDKILAKQIAKASGVATIPGTEGEIKSVKEALKVAKKIGYPVILKASAGGGGKGMRRVDNQKEMLRSVSSAQNEAKNSFADSRIFIEKFIQNPRHIEIQILADQYGNYLCLGERECSIQRKHQKVVEEAPSVFVDEKMRKKMYAKSVALAKKVGYFSAGTMEYIVDEKKNFYFLEMNTRLQVEHAVTELITSTDIVEQMILIARKEKLGIKQKDIVLKGWAFESRVYAEDPSSGFLPSTGRIDSYHEPQLSENVRVDSGVFSGAEISMFYDPMIAKVCSYGDTRYEAISKMTSALDQFMIRGVMHNMNLLQSIFRSKRFIAGDLSTNFLQEEYGESMGSAELSSEVSAVILSAVVFVSLKELERDMENTEKVFQDERYLGTRWIARLDEENYPVTVREITKGYRITHNREKFYIQSKWLLGSKLFQCTINGKKYTVQLEKFETGYKLECMGVSVVGGLYTPKEAELINYMKKIEVKGNEGRLTTNMAGQVVSIEVKEGEEVAAGQVLATVEAMKMENLLRAPISGTVKRVYCAAKDIVKNNDILLEIA